MTTNKVNYTIHLIRGHPIVDYNSTIPPTAKTVKKISAEVDKLLKKQNKGHVGGKLEQILIPFHGAKTETVEYQYPVKAQDLPAIVMKNPPKKQLVLNKNLSDMVDKALYMKIIWVIDKLIKSIEESIPWYQYDFGVTDELLGFPVLTSSSYGLIFYVTEVNESATARAKEVLKKFLEDNPFFDVIVINRKSLLQKDSSDGVTDILRAIYHKRKAVATDQWWNEMIGNAEMPPPVRLLVSRVPKSGEMNPDGLPTRQISNSDSVYPLPNIVAARTRIYPTQERIPFIPIWSTTTDQDLTEIDPAQDFIYNKELRVVFQCVKGLSQYVKDYEFDFFLTNRLTGFPVLASYAYRIVICFTQGEINKYDDKCTDPRDEDIFDVADAIMRFNPEFLFICMSRVYFTSEDEYSKGHTAICSTLRKHRPTITTPEIWESLFIKE